MSRYSNHTEWWGLGWGLFGCGEQLKIQILDVDGTT